jgi:excisionase family DNA binding protein
MPKKKIDTEDQVFDRKTAARYLGYSPGTLAVWKSTKRYNLPSVKIGRAIRYRKSDLDKFLEERLIA